MRSTVYLAGPITGCSYNGCTEWREVAQLRLAEAGIKALSPMRGKDYFKHVQKFTNNGDRYAEAHGASSVLSTNRGIMTRDRFDATRCDALLVNLKGARQVSIGTVMEIAWADAKRTPIVAIIEPEGNMHDHGMIREAIGFRVETLEEALHVLKVMLG